MRVTFKTWKYKQICNKPDIHSIRKQQTWYDEELQVLNNTDKILQAQSDAQSLLQKKLLDMKNQLHLTGQQTVKKGEEYIKKKREIEERKE
jgi:hypothetical protein